MASVDSRMFVCLFIPDVSELTIVRVLHIRTCLQAESRIVSNSLTFHSRASQPIRTHR